MKIPDIPLDELRQYFSYDSATGIFRNRSNERIVGYPDNEGYTRIYFRRCSFRANRLAWALTHEAWPKHTVDHINRIRSDTRIANLRLANRAENSANLGIRPSNQSGFKGVGVHAKVRGFTAQIKVRGRGIWLGVFATPEDAAMAYDRAATYFFGEFAATNYSMGKL